MISARFMKKWYNTAIIPLYVFSGAAVGWAGFMAYRALRGPEVIWSKANPQPWNTIQNQQVKLMAVNQKFDGKWSR